MIIRLDGQSAPLGGQGRANPDVSRDGLACSNQRYRQQGRPGPFLCLAAVAA
jgi:hypothetical protein